MRDLSFFNLLCPAALRCLLLFVLTTSAFANEAGAAPQVVTSLRPLALMASTVIGSSENVYTLLKPGQSPHHFSLRVSDRRRLQDADLVLWVGPQLETYMTRVADPLRSLTMTAVVMLDASNHQGGEAGHRVQDSHLWLNPAYGSSMLKAIAKRLGTIDPVNAARYQRNAEREVQRLQGLTVSAPSPGAGRYAVAHNAYSHWLAYFSYPAPLVLSTSPELSPGAKRLWQVGNSLEAGNCLLVEPEHARGWVETFARRNQLRLVEMDILGHNEKVSDYFTLMAGIASQFKQCLR